MEGFPWGRHVQDVDRVLVGSFLTNSQTSHTGQRFKPQGLPALRGGAPRENSPGLKAAGCLSRVKVTLIDTEENENTDKNIKNI